MYLHPATEKRLQNLLQRPPQAIGVVAEEGSGKGYLAQHLATKLLDIEQGHLGSYPYFMHVDADQKVGIDDMRQLHSELGVKVPSKSAINRVVIIEHADKLGHEAQNALLKTIEEPPSATVLILTFAPSNKLLGTIKSRLQTIEHRPLSLELAHEQLITGQYKSSEIDKAYAMSGGRIALLVNLLEGKETELGQSISLAKELLVSDRFTRLCRVDEILKNGPDPHRLLSAIRVVLGAASRPSKVSEPHLDRLQMVDDAIVDMQVGGNKKLIFTDLFSRL